MIEWLFKVLGLTAFLKWLSPSFEDEKGQTSFRRITPFILTGTCVYMIYSDKLPVADRKFAFTAMLVGAAFYAGLITFQNVFALWQSFKGNNVNQADLVPDNSQTIYQPIKLEGTLTTPKNP